MINQGMDPTQLALIALQNISAELAERTKRLASEPPEKFVISEVSRLFARFCEILKLGELTIPTVLIGATRASSYNTRTHAITFCAESAFDTRIHGEEVMHSIRTITKPGDKLDNSMSRLQRRSTEEFFGFLGHYLAQEIINPLFFRMHRHTPQQDRYQLAVTNIAEERRRLNEIKTAIRGCFTEPLERLIKSTDPKTYSGIGCREEVVACRDLIAQQRELCDNLAKDGFVATVTLLAKIARYFELNLTERLPLLLDEPSSRLQIHEHWKRSREQVSEFDSVLMLDLELHPTSFKVLGDENHIVGYYAAVKALQTGIKPSDLLRDCLNMTDKEVFDKWVAVHWEPFEEPKSNSCEC